MKKALLYLTTSLLILMGLLAYDIVKCDGNVILNPLLNIDNTYTGQQTQDETTKNKRQEKITVTTPDIISYADVPVVEENSDEGLPEATEVASISDDERGYEFYFPQLTEHEKSIYRAVYNAFVSIESGTIIPTGEDAEMNRAVTAIKNDHPEFFYLGEMGYTHYTLGGQVQRSTLSVDYTESDTIIKTQQRMIDAEVTAIINSIPAGADDYTKVKHVYEAIINMTDYEIGAPNNQNIVSVFINKRSVCAGYTRAMQYILNKVGVPTTFVEGKSLLSGEDHAWNLCKLEDGYYYVDATWGDASYSNDSADGLKLEDINYDYLLVTSEELLRTHSISSNVEVPVCTSIANNYYVREGLYLTEYNYDYIKSVFDNGYANGKRFVSFKCANLDVYNDVMGQLIRNNVIFDMLGEDTKTVSYLNDEEQRTLCFWL